MRRSTRPHLIETHLRASKGAAPALPWSIEMKRPADLKPPLRKVRTHTDAQIDFMANSFLQFGFIGAIVVDRRNRIVAGWARWMAAQRIGLRFVPVIRLENLSDDELRA